MSLIIGADVVVGERRVGVLRVAAAAPSPVGADVVRAHAQGGAGGGARAAEGGGARAGRVLVRRRQLLRQDGEGQRAVRDMDLGTVARSQVCAVHADYKINGFDQFHIRTTLEFAIHVGWTRGPYNGEKLAESSLVSGCLDNLGGIMCAFSIYFMFVDQFGLPCKRIHLFNFHCRLCI